MIRKLFLSFSMALLLFQPITGLAIQSSTLEGVDADATFWSDIDTCTSTDQAATAASSLAALGNVPTVWRDLISAAATDHPNSDPRLVAIALWVENRGWPEYKTTGWATSYAAAQGPWQFIPSSWASMGRDGNGDGKKDPNDPADAVHAAFVHFEGSAGKPIAVTGYSAGATAEANFETIVFEKGRPYTNLLAFLSAYNGSGAPSGTKLKDFGRGQNSDYVIMSYWLLATDLKKSYEPNTGQFVDATTAVKTDPTGASNIGATNACDVTGAIGSVNTEGYAWPVAPQTKDQNGGVAGLSQLPCPGGTCHHDRTPAFDLGRKPGGDDQVGAPVYAIVDSEVDGLSDNYKGQAGCFSIQLKGTQKAENGKQVDNFYYANLHLQKPLVKKGQQVKAGTQIAEIGARRCTGNGSTPHLHIDRGCIINNVPQRGGRDECRDPKFVDLINKLYNELPEK